MTNGDFMDIETAAHFYLDPFVDLLAAMVLAEGGRDAFVKALQCSLPATKDFPEALARACKTVRNTAIAFSTAQGGQVLRMLASGGDDPWTGEATPKKLIVTDEFIDFLAAKWPPLGVANDPTNLNANWGRNVKDIYRKRVLTDPILPASGSGVGGG